MKRIACFLVLIAVLGIGVCRGQVVVIQTRVLFPCTMLRIRYWDIVVSVSAVSALNLTFAVCE